jgi:hypothetical protein
MLIKKLTDKRVSELFHISDRNLQQTYKNPKPTNKKVLTKEELKEKDEQYQIIRLGATCKEHNISEEILLNTINLIKSIK